MSDRLDMPRGEGDIGDQPEKRRIHFPLKSAVALVVIVLVGLPVFSMLQPGYYHRYADLKPRMENWSVSTHARIPCAGCHVEPGPKGYLAFATHSIPAFYSQLVNGPRPANLLSIPDTDACQKCHTTYRDVSPAGDLLIPHRAHVEILELNCSLCHKDLVHSENDQGFNSPEMISCLELCHDGEQATAECVDCHTRKNVPDSHDRKDWLTVHSEMTKTDDCGECHAWSPDFCAECHAKRPESHAGNWKKLHQFPALERGDKGCTTCHAEEFCKQCHD